MAFLLWLVLLYEEALLSCRNCLSLPEKIQIKDWHIDLYSSNGNNRIIASLQYGNNTFVFDFVQHHNRIFLIQIMALFKRGALSVVRLRISVH